MEKEKLLCILKFIRITILLSLLFKGFWVYGSDADLEQIINELHQKKLEPFISLEDGNEADNLKPQLFIFISTSMPIPLLKSYYKEAAKYAGVLVFKGLPNGSFKELSRLMQELNEPSEKDGKRQAAAIIDDESFEKFGIKHVPSFVLFKEEECFTESSCKITYDKIVGNIGIKAALNEFIEHGELKEAALQRMK